MDTNVSATKDRLRGVRAGRYHSGGGQCRRDMRAALHELQQRLEQCHNRPSLMRVVVTADPAPSIAGRIRRTLFQRLRSFYTVFTSCGLL
jgi:hypothetical protein